jgi:hypothetical protein
LKLPSLEDARKNHFNRDNRVPETEPALGFDFNPAVFTAITRYECFLPASAFVSVYRIGTSEHVLLPDEWCEPRKASM